MIEPSPSGRHPRARGPRILAVANQKGGVGKTTTAINLATALVAVGRRTLIIDLDPQGNASTGLGVASAARTRTSYDVLLGEAGIAEAAVATEIPGLRLVPSSLELSGAELEIGALPRRQFLLRDALAQASGVADYVLIDCPPALSLLTINALVAAAAILVPLQCEFFALEGLSQLLRTIDRVKASLNPELTVQGIVLTMFDRRNNLSSQVAEDVRRHLGAAVYRTVIPRNVRVSEAPSFGKPALIYDHRCPGSQAYIQLASELLKRDAALRAA